MSSIFSAIPDRPAVLRPGQIWSPLGSAVDLPWSSPPPSAAAPQDIQPRAVLASGVTPPAVMKEIVPPAPPPGAASKTLAGKAGSQSMTPPSMGGSRLPLTGAMGESWRDILREASTANLAEGLPEVGGERAFDYDTASDAAFDYKRGRDDAYDSWYSARIDKLPDLDPFADSGGRNWINHPRFNELPSHWPYWKRQKAITYLSRAESGERK